MNYMEYASLLDTGWMVALAMIVLFAYRHLRAQREYRHGGTKAIRTQAQSWARTIYAKNQ
jgi:hypothetical protein